MAASQRDCPRSLLPRSSVSVERIRVTSDMPVDPCGVFVLYWMTAARRTSWNFAFDRAVDWARELGKPLLVVEVLRCYGLGHNWDSTRHHTFVLQGMADNARRLADAPVRYYPFVELDPKQNGFDLMAKLAARACAVVTDDYPIGQHGCISESLPVRREAVDGNGLLPMRLADKAFTTAHAFRRFLQRRLPDFLLQAPRANPLARVKLPPMKSLSREITQRWPPATAALLRAEPSALAALPIDQDVLPVATRGGSKAAGVVLKRFLRERLARYAEQRNAVDDEVASGLSPYLHHGHISAHEIFQAIARCDDWSPDRLADKATGRREGWWGMSAAAEAFLDELVTWREVGFNMCAERNDYYLYESLPDWAQKTLAKHARERREYVYSLDEFDAAATHDPLWNAAQRQLVTEGRIHNYLRMLWGKKILEWTATPQEALEVMIELNNRYAIDGCDPNSYSGVFWVLGRYDRAWGPERPVFGTVRYMSSENTARKLRVADYLKRYGSTRTGE